jgi:hypothetical protein
LDKKLVAIFIAVLMIVSILPATIPHAAAEEEESSYPSDLSYTREKTLTNMEERYTGCETFLAEQLSAVQDPKSPYQGIGSTEEYADWVANGGSPLCVFLHPGVEDAYKPGFSHTLGTLWNLEAGGMVNPTGAQRRQIFDKYLDYAILASSSDSVGDFQFDILVITPVNYISIYVPPDFTFMGATKKESVWTDITDDYGYISVSTRSQYDDIAPGWTRVRIRNNGLDDGSYTRLYIEPGLYHVRLFNLRAPDYAGLFHFKIYTNLGSIGFFNFPFTIVKTELNPAYAVVNVKTVLYGPGAPFVSGHVWAEGTTPEGRAVKGVAYWSAFDYEGYEPMAGANGNVYEAILWGLAAGTYTITAEASGFNPSSAPGGLRITLDPGQSYKLWISIYDSPDLSVTVWSKHGTGAIPWHNLWQLPFGTNCPTCAIDDDGPRRDILLDLYDSEGTLISFWFTDWFDIKYVGQPLGAGGRTVGNNELYTLADGSLALDPAATNSHFALHDNYDVLGDVRQYPSTHWDGHVPWDFADYIAGYPDGQYTIEGFVTGYVMDEADAYQRTFTMIGSHKEIQFDLRRSNWVDITMHLPSTVTDMSKVGATATLVAEDANGNERGAAAFRTRDVNVDGRISAPDVLCDDSYPADFGGVTFCNMVTDSAHGIILEGWNLAFPNMEDEGADISLKDYGLNPSASTHSAGAVELAGNPYTIKLYMADMGVPHEWPQLEDPMGTTGLKGTGWWQIIGGDPQVSVYLCNTPVYLSFKIINTYVWISIRSVDFEVPAHSRPWTFPGSEIFVEFKDMDGNVVDTLDPTVGYGLIQDPGVTADFPSGFEIPGNEAALGLGGDDSKGLSPFDVDNVNLAGHHEHLGVWYFGTDWCSPASGFGGLNSIDDCILPWYRSTRLPAGEYTFEAYTHGYVMRRAFPFQVPISGHSDIEADMIQGGQIRVGMSFYHEAVATNFNGFIRVEVFNDAGELVGASIYGQAEPNIYTRAGNGGAYFDFEGWASHMIGYDPNDGVPANTEGFQPAPAEAAGWDCPESPDSDFGAGPACYAWTPSASSAQRAFTSWYFYNVPGSADTAARTGPDGRMEDTWSWYPGTTPSDAMRVNVPAGDEEKFDVFGFYWYYGHAARTWAGGWPTTDGVKQPNMGLRGSVEVPGWAGSGGGLYTVKVWAFDPYGPNGAWDPTGVVDDWRMYAMGWDLTGIQVPWGGAVDVYVDMNNLASLRGTVRWLDMFGNLRALPWAQISASPGPSTDSVPAYSSGNGAVGGGASDPSGAYLMWLPAGAHDVSVSTSEAPGVWSSASPTINAQYSVVVSDGWVGGGDTQLSTSGVPVPELPAYAVPLGLFAVLAASVWLLRKRNLNTPILMK